MDFLKENNLILNKHIPHHYKCNSRQNQLSLLAGIIDSDGYCYHNCYEIVQKKRINESWRIFINGSCIYFVWIWKRSIIVCKLKIENSIRA